MIIKLTIVGEADTLDDRFKGKSLKEINKALMEIALTEPRIKSAKAEEVTL